MITLNDLPSPPAGSQGWPWTEASPPLPLERPDGRPWPAISIVTPSFNQGQFLEDTIRSVLLQGYPSLEYIIIDGGSDDESVEVIRRYEPWLTFWQSGPDGGQADAVNIGLAHASGEIFNFINSDDVLLPGALQFIGALDADRLGIAGSVICRGAAGDDLFVHGEMSFGNLVSQDHFHQPGIWLKRQQVVDIGGFDPGYNFCFDKKFYLRFLARYDGTVATTAQPLVIFRLHDQSKTVTSHASFRDESLRALLDVMPEIAGEEDRAKVIAAVARIRNENARDAVLSAASDLLRSSRDSLAARLRVGAQMFRGDAAGARTKLFEMCVFGGAEAQRRSLARKAKRAVKRMEHPD
jgi:glycosyltransferase involved in cell wall biosynthesis